MHMLDNEQLPSQRSNIPNTSNLLNELEARDRSYLSISGSTVKQTKEFTVGDDQREAYLRTRERLIELEVEKEEKDKSIILLQEVREKERREFNKQLAKA